MEAEKEQKLKDIFAKNTLGVFIETNPTEEAFLTSHALKSALIKAGKSAFFDTKQHEDMEKKWRDIIPEQNTANTHNSPRKIRIKIPKTEELSEINYEDGGEFLNFLISPKEKEISAEKIIVEAALPELGAAFCFFEKESLLEKITHCALPDKSNIVMIVPNAKLLTEKVFDLVCLLGRDNDPEVATLLFAALVCETANFSRHISREALLLAEKLLKRGADKNAVKKAEDARKTAASAKILGRALARTHVDEALKTVWTFLPQKDFAKTGARASADLFLQIIRSFTHVLPERPRYLILWEENEKVKGFVFSRKEEHIRPLALKLGTQLESTFFATPEYRNFTEAEMTLRKLLKELI